MSEAGGSEDDTVKIKRPKINESTLVGVLCFAIGGGTGTAGTLAVTKNSVDRLTVQVEKLETRVESILLDRVTRADVEALRQRRDSELDKIRADIEKLREEVRHPRGQ